MPRRRVIHVLAYVPLMLLGLSAIVTMLQVGCSGSANGFGYGYGPSGSSSGFAP